MRGILGFAGTILLTGGFVTVTATPAAAAPLEFTIPEDASPGTPIGRATDDTGAAISSPDAEYDIAHDGRGVPFLIDPRSGAISLATTPLDFEQQSRHEFTVHIRKPRALDTARRAYLSDLLVSGVDPDTLDDLLFEVSERRIAVIVTDAAEPPVLTSDPLTIVVRDADRSASTQVTIVDPDADDSHAFELIAGDAERFQIDPQSGVLTYLAGTGDGGTFPVTVHVTDDDGLSDAVTFTVEVIVPPAAVTLAAQAPVEIEDAAPTEVPPSTATPDSAADVALQTALREPDPNKPAHTALQEPAADGGLPGNLVEPPLADVDVPADLSDAALLIADNTVVRSPTEHAAIAETVPAVAAPLAANTGAIAVAGSESVPAAAGSRVRAVSLRTLLALAFLMLAAGVGAIAVLLRRLRRTIPVEEPQPSAFRVVREARMLTAATGGGQRPPASDEVVPTATAADPGQQDADKAAVHELIASAFQQAAAPVVQPQANASDPNPDPIPTRIVMPASPLPPPLPAAALAVDLEPEHEVVFVDEVIAEPADDMFAASSDDVMPDELHETVDTSDNHWMAAPADDVVEPEPQNDTEPFSLPYAQFDSAPAEMTSPADNQTQTVDFAGLHAMESSISTPGEATGYDAPDDDLGGGYYGLRLSQSVAPPAEDDIAPAEAMPYSEAEADPAGTSRTADFRPTDSKPPADDDDPKVKELRRQLSDLFGVSTDRPRPTPAPIAEAERSPARTVDFDRGLLAQEDLSESSAEAPFEPVEHAEPSATPVAAEPQADPESASDPVSSWLAYLKQRTLDQSATSSRGATVPSPPPAPVVAKPAASAPSPAPAPVAIPQRSTPATPASVMRVDKTAVREEITLLRNVANRHSRNVLARRASHQRARFAWVLWGTSLVILCFTGLYAVQHGSGLIRMVGWLLFACAAMALAGCVHGFRGLTSRPERAPDEVDDSDVTTAEDFDRTTAPELMTLEMEERLRSVMDEAPAAPVGAMESES